MASAKRTPVCAMRIMRPRIEIYTDLPSRPSGASLMYRLRRDGQEPVIDVDQLGAIEPAIRSSEPGRYHIDQIERDPLPSGVHWHFLCMAFLHSSGFRWHRLGEE